MICIFKIARRFGIWLNGAWSGLYYIYFISIYGKWRYSSERGMGNCEYKFQMWSSVCFQHSLPLEKIKEERGGERALIR